MEKKVEEVQGLGEGLGPEIGPMLAKAVSDGQVDHFQRTLGPLVYQIF